MESHELTSSVMNIENTLQEILSVLRETQESGKPRDSAVYKMSDSTVNVEITPRAKKQSKEIKETN